MATVLILSRNGREQLVSSLARAGFATSTMTDASRLPSP